MISRTLSFGDKPVTQQINPRQRKALAKLLDGFVGDMTSAKYANLTKCSHDTASRNLEELVKFKLLQHNGKACRSSDYRLI
jgi:Fic family protein